MGDAWSKLDEENERWMGKSDAWNDGNVSKMTKTAKLVILIHFTAIYIVKY